MSETRSAAHARIAPRAGRIAACLLAAGVLLACGAPDDGERSGGGADTAVVAGVAPGDGARPASPSTGGDAAIEAFVARIDPSLFTRWGACPFECCVYRDWVAEAQVVVRAEPDTGARIVVAVPAGDRLLADTGFVRITSAQLIVVSDAVEANRHRSGERWSSQPDTLVAGDTLLLLEPLGEGYSMLARGDELYSAQQFWPAEDGWQPYGGARGRTVGTHAAEWWAHVTTAEGAQGWIDAYASELGNVDACGP